MVSYKFNHTQVKYLQLFHEFSSLVVHYSPTCHDTAGPHETCTFDVHPLYCSYVAGKMLMRFRYHHIAFVVAAAMSNLCRGLLNAQMLDEHLKMKKVIIIMNVFVIF